MHFRYLESAEFSRVFHGLGSTIEIVSPLLDDPLRFA